MKQLLFFLLIVSSLALGQDAKYSRYSESNFEYFVKILSRVGEPFEARVFRSISNATLGSPLVVMANVTSSYVACTVWQYLGQQSGSLVFRVVQQYLADSDLSAYSRNLVSAARVGARQAMGDAFTTACTLSVKWQPADTLMFYVPLTYNMTDVLSFYAYGSVNFSVLGMNVAVKLSPFE